MNKPVVLGIVGAGNIGKLHMSNLINDKNVRIKTVSDLFIEHFKNNEITENMDVLTDDYMDILGDEEINAVMICSPTNTHIPLIKEAAKKGKHIFCEKPISFSDEESIEAYREVKEAGVIFQIGFNRRFDKNFSSIRERVANGKIGTPHILKITSRDPKPPHIDYIASSGGLFYDMTIHDFDMARFMMDSEVVEVYAQGANLVNEEIREKGDIDTAIITLTFDNGAIGVIDNSREAVYGYDQRVEMFGNKGTLTADNETPTNITYYHQEGVQQDNPLYFFLERYNDAYIAEVSDFIKSVLA